MSTRLQLPDMIAGNRKQYVELPRAKDDVSQAEIDAACRELDDLHADILPMWMEWRTRMLIARDAVLAVDTAVQGREVLDARIAERSTLEDEAANIVAAVRARLAAFTTNRRALRIAANSISMYAPEQDHEGYTRGILATHPGSIGAMIRAYAEDIAIPTGE